eukprot:1872216-Prymnesium_polylepis.1
MRRSTAATRKTRMKTSCLRTGPLEGSVPRRIGPCSLPLRSIRPARGERTASAGAAVHRAAAASAPVLPEGAWARPMRPSSATTLAPGGRGAQLGKYNIINTTI